MSLTEQTGTNRFFQPLTMACLYSQGKMHDAEAFFRLTVPAVPCEMNLGNQLSLGQIPKVTGRKTLI